MTQNQRIYGWKKPWGLYRFLLSHSKGATGAHSSEKICPSPPSSWALSPVLLSHKGGNPIYVSVCTGTLGAGRSGWCEELLIHLIQVENQHGQRMCLKHIFLIHFYHAGFEQTRMKNCLFILLRRFVHYFLSDSDVQTPLFFLNTQKTPYWGL